MYFLFNFAVMKKVYLDNASTTAMRPEVIAEMAKVMGETFGNPSSTHSFGRSAKVALETARKTIAALIGAEAREIIFTSGGTESDNWIIRSAVRDLKVQRIITSKIEHHAVLNTVEAVAAEYNIKVDYVRLKPSGAIDMQHLEELLQQDMPTLVALMHVNNETGVVLNLKQAGELCRQYNALFFSDTIQSVGKDTFNLQELPVDFITASAHKFHGPKGVGFAFVRKNTALRQMLHGGEQEKGMRAGTEAVHQVAGMAKALEVAYSNLQEEKAHVSVLKDYLIQQLNMYFPGYKINGGDAVQFYNIINVLLPLPEEKTAMILFNLDMKGIAVSRGSACQSGSIKPSHVLSEMLPAEDVLKPSLRISFSHYNTKEDIDLFVEALKTV
jgi:cysteine desulfurase